MKVNKIPYGYNSWLKLLIDQKHNFESVREKMKVVDLIDQSNRIPDYQIYKDYLLLMAMKELLPLLLDRHDLELLFYASKIGFDQIVVDAGRKDHIIETLFQKLKLLSK